MCCFDEIHHLIREREALLLRYACLFLRDMASSQDAVGRTLIRYVRLRQEKTGLRVESPTALLLQYVRAEVMMESPGSCFRLFPSDRNNGESLCSAIGELTPQEQELLFLHYAAGLSDEDAATVVTGLNQAELRETLIRIMDTLLQKCPLEDLR